MIKALLRFIFGAAVACLANVTFAAGMANFVGVGLGNTTAEVNGSPGQVTTSGAGYRIIAGNQIAQIFSVEAEFVDLGQFPTATSNVAAKALGISGVLNYPIMGIFAVYGRAGLARVETTVTPLAGFVPGTPLSDTVVGLSLG